MTVERGEKDWHESADNFWNVRIPPMAQSPGKIVPLPHDKPLRWTPGPWRVFNKTDIENEGCWLIAQVIDVDERDALIPPAAARANAHLIASAPRLYAALLGILNRITSEEQMFLGLELREADAALAAARGETP